MNEAAGKHPHGKHGEEDIYGFNNVVGRQNAEVVEDFTEIENVQCAQKSKILKGE